MTNFLYNLLELSISFIMIIIFLTKKKNNTIQKYKIKCTNYEKKISGNKENIYILQNKLIKSEEYEELSEYYKKKYEDIKNKLQIQLNLNHTQELQLQKTNIQLENYKNLIIEKQKNFEKNEKELIKKFKDLSIQILNQNEYKIEEKSKLIMNQILSPFREQLNTFTNQIQNNFTQETRDRHALTYEIRNLHQLNMKITQETINLTKALKGKNKIQGNWGEITLIRSLEASGMREGHEFHFQTCYKTNDENQKKMQPDVLVHLPHNKEIIIDSKMSLTAYERYFNSEHEKDKKLSISNHIQSIRNHIKSLNKKEYQKILGLKTLDFIIMFIPIESALILAINHDPSLLTEAMNHDIMLTSPTTLLIALRTIHNLWSHEYQNRYTKKIADQAGHLYDKLRLFTNDLEKIGQYLNKAIINYQDAKNKFSQGKGNIISQAENFRLFGVKIKKPIISSIKNDLKNSVINFNTENKKNTIL